MRENKITALIQENAALRAEVAALRGMAGSEAAQDALNREWGGVSTPSTKRLRAGLAAALATVPPAKVADAVKAEVPGLDPLAKAMRGTAYGGDVVHTVDVPTTLDRLIERVNVLSAIAKRGGL